MSYKINTTNGALLVDLIDGRIDDSSTDLTLVGRNFTGYGEAFNENFVKILENFANTAAPSTPIVGQLWYDTSEARLKIYNGEQFKASNATIVSASTPATLVAGELWIDTANKQLRFSDGDSTFLAGPIYTSEQGQSGFDVQTLVDEFGNPKVVVRLLVAAQPVAIISRELFNTTAIIPNFGTQLKEGINISSLYSNFDFHGTASTTSSLSGITATGFMKTNTESEVIGNTTNGILNVQTDLGLTIGYNAGCKLLISGNNTILRNQTSASGIKFQVNTGPTESEDFLIDYLTVDTSAGNIGIWQDNPQYNLDITGDVGISGSLNVSSGVTVTGNFVVDDIGLDSSTISTTANPLTIVSNGAISVNSQRIAGILDPTDAQDAASKNYVDTVTGNDDVFFSLDITGLTNSEIAEIIETMVSASIKDNAVEALIHCTEYSGTNTYNASDGITKTFVTVDKSGTENQSVLEDILFNDATNTLALTIVRTLKRFRVVTGTWTYIEDVV